MQIRDIHLIVSQKIMGLRDKKFIQRLPIKELKSNESKIAKKKIKAFLVSGHSQRLVQLHVCNKHFNV